MQNTKVASLFSVTLDFSEEDLLQSDLLEQVQNALRQTYPKSMQTLAGAQSEDEQKKFILDAIRRESPTFVEDMQRHLADYFKSLKDEVLRNGYSKPQALKESCVQKLTSAWSLEPLEASLTA